MASLLWKSGVSKPLYSMFGFLFGLVESLNRLMRVFSGHLSHRTLCLPSCWHFWIEYLIDGSAGAPAPITMMELFGAFSRVMLTVARSTAL